VPGVYRSMSARRTICANASPPIRRCRGFRPG
jgi:hypothetical protein